jgi:hypothetical protein
MTVPKLCNFHAITFHTYLSLLLFFWNIKHTPYGSYCILFDVEMVPVVRINLNNFQDLLSHNDAKDDMKAHGWDVFLKTFEGYNLPIAQTFT